MLQECVIQLDGEHGVLGLVRRGVTSREDTLVLTHIPRRRSHGLVLDLVELGREAELPAPRSPSDGELVLVVDPNPRGGEDTAVVGTTGPRAMLIDRALVADHAWVARWYSRKPRPRVFWSGPRDTDRVAGRLGREAAI